MASGLFLGELIFLAGASFEGIAGILLSGIVIAETLVLIGFFFLEGRATRSKNRLSSIKQERALAIKVSRRLDDENVALTGGPSLSSNERDDRGRISLKQDESGGTHTS